MTQGSFDHLHNYAYMREISIIHRWCDIQQIVVTQVKIVLSQRYEQNEGVVLALGGVQQVKVDELDAGIRWHLQITDISHRGWEGVRFEVRDVEQDKVVITCKSVSLIPTLS